MAPQIVQIVANETKASIPPPAKPPVVAVSAPIAPVPVPQTSAKITGSLISQRWDIVISGRVTPKAFKDLQRAVKLAYRKNNALIRKSLSKPISGVTTNVS